MTDDFTPHGGPVERRAELLVPLTSAAIILSEDDFTQALQDADRAHDDADPTAAVAFSAAPQTRADAADLAGLANDPGCLGVIGDLHIGGPQPFRGDLFIVTRDATFDPSTRRIEATTFAVAAVELSGTAEWLGSASRLALTLRGSPSAGRCCGPPTICVPAPSGPGPGPGPCLSGICPSDRVGLSNHPPDPLQTRIDHGAPVIGLSVFTTDPRIPGGLVASTFSCVTVLDRGCARITPLCGSDDIGYEADPQGFGNPQVGSQPCQPRPGDEDGSGRKVPKICTMISGWNQLPAECGGLCESCGQPYDVQHRLNASCAVMTPAPDSDMCRTPSAVERALNNARMQLETGWVKGQPTESCTPTRRGGQVCTNCDAAGNCAATVRKPLVDPTIADDTTPERNPEFDPQELLGHRPDPPEPPAPPKEPPAPPDPYVLRDGATGRNAPGNPATPPEPPPSSAPSPQGAPSGKLVGKPGRRAGDPVEIGDGSFDLDHVDLAFPGPVGTLAFRRVYSSRSTQRSTLGSNWQHQWDVRIEPLTPDTIPAWASPYCAGAPDTETALLLHDGDGWLELFCLDLQSGLFMPQAGSTDTISAAAGGGWALRSPDGRVRLFNPLGYLVSDRDRFGNGVTIDYEPTPLGLLYDYYCSPSALAARNETKYARRNAALAYLVGDGPKPAAASDAWRVSAADYPLPPPAADPELSDRLAYGVDCLLHLLAFGPNVQSVDGARRLRPTRVTDDLGRQLIFSYRRAAKLPPKPPTALFPPAFAFATTPDADLLISVEGPDGCMVRFTYERPAAYPAELNEMFLVAVDRHDRPAEVDVAPAVDRSLRFTYQWPGGPVGSYDTHAAAVRDAYRAYYQAFVGCTYADQYACGDGIIKLGGLRLADDDPDTLARQAEQAYISDIADNIIRVVADGVDESETRYEADPFLPVFDRVTAQRYGSVLAEYDPGRLPPDTPEDHWQTALPKLTLAYQDAGPVPGGGDLTDGFLPAIVRDRYPLEDAPAAAVARGAGPVAGGGPQPCDYPAMEQLRITLPGARDTVPYYDPTPAQTHPSFIGRLYRCRLNPEQLTLAQLSDPTHNDVLSVLQPNPATPGNRHSLIAQRLVGRRRVIAANANRICSWTQVVDRDGDTHLYGLNYRGQPLVDAVRDRDDQSQWLFTERLYNADGSLVQQRRPTRGPKPWEPQAGSTTFTYDEIDPHGAHGWNDWLPVFWSRRRNLVRSAEHAAGLGVADMNEQTGVVTSSVGRFSTYSYEPLFNQVASVESGSVELRPSGNLGLAATDVPHRRVDYVFDYQELSPTAPASDPASLSPVLDAFLPWGFSWLTTATGAYDMTTITDWQLPLTFFDADLNGDGLVGFGYGTRPADRARGVPVLVVERHPGDPAAPLVTSLGWAPHGRPAAVVGPDGSATLFEYYSISPTLATGSPYGQDRPPTDAEVSGGFRGLLGRIRTRRFRPGYDPSYGPPGGVCAALAGPYQWLLPASSTNPQADLAALGLPSETVSAVLASTTAAGVWRDRAFTYSTLGHLRRVWADTAIVQVVRDTDGRELQVIDPAGTRTRITYTAAGQPQTTSTQDAAGTLIGESRRAYDEEGRLVYECTAASSGGCLPPGAPVAADGVVRRYTYSGEGRLTRTMHPEGAQTSYRYDARGLLVHAHITAPAPSTDWRGTSYAYTDDGDLAEVHYGDQTGDRSGLLTETFSYDGLRRVISATDNRGYPWQAAYSPRDLLLRVKQDEIGYGAAAIGSPSWETTFAFDAYERLTQRSDNGTVTSRLQRTAEGRVFRASAAGFGDSFMAYDLEGQPTWTRDPSGTEMIYTDQPDLPARSVTTIRRGRGDIRHVVATLQQLDPVGLPTTETAFGAGVRLSTVLHRDGAGRVVRVEHPDGTAQTVDWDWLGRPTAISAPFPATGVPTAVTTLTYTGLGQVRRLVDPSGEVTETDYTAFGQVRERRVRGTPPVTTSYTYDPLGRVEITTVGTLLRTKRDYDERGDPILDSVWELGAFQPVTARAYDALGRLTYAEDINFALSGIWPTPPRTVTVNLDYDRNGRTHQQQLQVGGSGVRRTVVADWALIGGRWQCETQYAAAMPATSRQQSYDLAGRPATRTRLVNGLPTQRTSFNWIGDIYAGRIQEQPGHPSPLREQLTLDALGAVTGSRYTAIDLDPAGLPQNATEGVAYCGPIWSTPCAQPLLETHALRDRAGRIASLHAQFGHSVPGPTGPIAASHPRSWRGYVYTPSGELESVFQDAGVTGGIDDSNLSSYTLTAQDIATLGAAVQRWHYSREAQVPSTTAITDGQTTRWSLPTPRGPGHQLRGVTVDGVSRNIGYDDAGRITTDGTLTYAYNHRGALVSVSRNNVLLESYAYDGLGRLVGVLTGTAGGNPSTTSFLYDGVQIVAAFDPSGLLQWEAGWGPGLDQLIEWHDHAGGTGEHIPLLDQRNSVVATWKPGSERLTETADYNPEGRMLLRAPNDQTVCEEATSGQVCANPARIPFGFASAWRSPVSGLVYMRNRWYAPELGQFLSQDPLGYTDSYNLYAYVGYDPINRTDPLGFGRRGFADPLLGVLGGQSGFDTTPLQKRIPPGLLDPIDQPAATEPTSLPSHPSTSSSTGPSTGPSLSTWGRILSILDELAVGLAKGFGKGGGPLVVVTTLLDSAPTADSSRDKGRQGWTPPEWNVSPRMDPPSGAPPIVDPTPLPPTPMLDPPGPPRPPVVNPTPPKPPLRLPTPPGPPLSLAVPPSSTTSIGQEAHRQLIEFLINNGGWDVGEITLELPGGQIVRKDLVRLTIQGLEVGIIKPATPSGVSAANSRARLMDFNGYIPVIILYDPDDPAWQPGSPSYKGPKKK
jgi:RHS repeat-associated protein